MEAAGVIMASPQHLAMAGFAATATAFGPGRIGFGLFLPRLRDTFSLTEPQAGFITSLAFAAFLLALPLSAWIVRRAGPRAPVLLGALSALTGFVLVGAASTTLFLAAGVAFAGASAGLCWTPFNSASEYALAPAPRAAVLSAVSTGATMGVALAATAFLISVFADVSWRAPWAAFALIALAALGLSGRCVPTQPRQAGGAAPDVSWRSFFRPSLIPLYAAALSFGVANGAYLAYAGVHVVSAGGLPGLPDAAASAVIYLIYGICGLIGLASGAIEARSGLPAFLTVIFSAFAASLALLALFPTHWLSLILSAGLQGAAVMTVSAVLSFWSLRLFPGAGTTGFTAALIAVAVGSIAGPALASAAVEAFGVRAALTACAAAPLLTAVAFALSGAAITTSFSGAEGR